jgi:hypothetical protein
MLLQELSTSTTTALFGSLPIRLDDAYHVSVSANLFLNLHTTSGSDDIAVDAQNPGAPSVRNLAPFDLHLTHYAASTPTGLTIVPVEQTLASGRATTLQPPAGAGELLIDRRLALLDPLPASDLIRYVRVNAEAVPYIHHHLSINATGVPWSPPSTPPITKIEAQISLQQAPAIAVPTITLTAGQPVDGVALDIPVTSAVTGLLATVSLAVTGGDPTKVAPHETLTHDFVHEPILVLTGTELGHRP